MKRRRSFGSNKVPLNIVSLTSETNFVTLEEQESKEESTQEIKKGGDIANNLVQTHSIVVGLNQVHTVQQFNITSNINCDNLVT